MAIKRTEKWLAVNVRLEPSLHRALVAYLHDPLYRQLPKGAVQEFANQAIRSELTRRGVPCDIQSSSSSPSSGTIQCLENF